MGSIRLWPYLVAFLTLILAWGTVFLRWLHPRLPELGSLVGVLFTCLLPPLLLVLVFHRVRVMRDDGRTARREAALQRQREDETLAARQREEVAARHRFSLEIRGLGVMLGSRFNLELLSSLGGGPPPDPSLIPTLLQSVSRNARMLSAVCGWEIDRLRIPVLAVTPEGVASEALERHFSSTLRELCLSWQDGVQLAVEQVFGLAEFGRALNEVFRALEDPTRHPAALLWVEGPPPGDPDLDFMMGILFTRGDALGALREGLSDEIQRRNPFTHHGKLAELNKRPAPLCGDFLGTPDENLLQAFTAFAQLPVIAHLHRPQGDTPLEACLERVLATLPEDRTPGSLVDDAQGEQRISLLRLLAEQLPTLKALESELHLDGTVGKAALQPLALGLSILRAAESGASVLCVSGSGEHPLMAIARPPEEPGHHPSGCHPAHVTLSWLDDLGEPGNEVLAVQGEDK